MGTFNLSPVVDRSEIDISNIVESVSTSTGAIVGASKRGKIGPQLVTNSRQITDEFGIPEPGNNFHYTGQAFVAQSTRLYMNRVINGALYGGLRIKDKDSSYSNIAVAAGITDPAIFGEGLGVYAWESDDVIGIFAPNPGVWNKLLAVRITNVNEADFEFDIELYEKDPVTNTYSLVDGFPKTVSRKQKLDGYGRSMYVEDIFPQDSLQLIIVDNTGRSDALIPKAQASNLIVTQGDDGSALTSGGIITGWKEFQNSEEITVNILMNNGYVDAAILSAMAAICDPGLSLDGESGRADCFAILDTPYQYTAAQLATWRDDTGTGIGSIDSSYVAAYASWVKIYDSYNDKYVFVPPSGFVGGAYAYTDFTRATWFPPAGLTRGRLSVQDVEKKWSKGERDTLYPAGINPIRKHPSGGIVIWGQKNLQKKASSTDRVNVRRLLILLENSIANSLQEFVFEFNNVPNRTQITSLIDGYLRDIKARQGLNDYRIICNSDNNSGDVMDRKELYVDIYIKPPQAAEFIKLRTIITRTAVSFSEVVGQI